MASKEHDALMAAIPGQSVDAKDPVDVVLHAMDVPDDAFAERVALVTGGGFTADEEEPCHAASA